MPYSVSKVFMCKPDKILLACPPPKRPTHRYLSLFANSLPSETAARVWDALLHEGPKVPRATGRALMKAPRGRTAAARTHQYNAWNAIWGPQGPDPLEAKLVACSAVLNAVIRFCSESRSRC